MQRQIKSALDRIEADEALVSRTEARLRKELAGVNSPTTFVKGRICEMKKFALAACLAVLLIGGGFVYATPTSYMYVDINPSIELGINGFDKVVSVEAMNDDGQAVLNELGRIKGMKLDDAVKLIVDEAVAQDFIAAGDSSFVELTAVTDNDKKAGKLLKYADQGTKEALEENEAEAEIGQAAVSHARCDAAKAAGISPGKLNLLQKLWLAQGNEIAEDADQEALEDIYEEILELENEDMDGDPLYKDGSVKDIMKAIKKIKVEDQADLKDDHDADDDDDDVTPGHGKAKAPGQLKKSNIENDDQQTVYLPNGKIKKNAHGNAGQDIDDDDDDHGDDQD